MKTKIVKTVSVSQMQEIDIRTSEEFGIPSIILMENAGRSVAEIVRKSNPKKIAVLCGSGNNGGDGLVAARYLDHWDFQVEIILIKSPDYFSGDTLTNFKIIKSLKIPVSSFATKSSLKDFELIIDALLGTGTKGEVTGIYREAIDEINNSQKKVYSIDVPSGIDADKGEILGTAVKADVTITMAIAKKGLVEPNASEYVGKLIVADIGIPKILVNQYQ
ncbi:MAG: NAD(P)H-hydrate epimerase [Elusimicrobia bacterium]|nr:NAD(P)H-hydrate epimerase [Elusimicrobiota bacterium]